MWKFAKYKFIMARRITHKNFDEIDENLNKSLE